MWLRLSLSRFPIGEPLWHKNGVMALTKQRRTPRQLNESSLQELALRYVGKYATTRAKLHAYLSRKLRERGWDGASPVDLEKLVERFATLGYVDDAAYALSKSRSLTTRGYGKRRLTEKLRVDGVTEDDSAAARELADQEAVVSAVRFAERRRLGPFANAPADPLQRRKWIAAMMRAGHGFALANAIAQLPKDAEIDMDWLRQCSGQAPD